MRLFICTDMEGVSGIINYPDYCDADGRYYQLGKSLLCGEVNAAVTGFLQSGAFDSIDVMDGHGQGGLDPLLLDKRVSFIRPHGLGWPLGLTSEYDAIAWVGQHAKAGTVRAHLAHSFWFDTLDITLNGISVGEFGQLCFTADELGVIPLFGCGDTAFCQEAEALVSGMVTVSVKEGLQNDNGRALPAEAYRLHNESARHLHPQMAQEKIRHGAYRAGRLFAQGYGFTVQKLTPPYTREVHLRPEGDKGKRSGVAVAASLMGAITTPIDLKEE